MATRIFAIDPGEKLEDVINTVGPTGTSGIVAVVVDLATNISDTSSRAPNKQEVLEALELIKLKIMGANWPPA